MLPLDAEKNDRRDYLLDMIEQLAELAREIGEIEVAIHLDATVEARRYALEKGDKRD
jgi:hypothetical protein